MVMVYHQILLDGLLPKRVSHRIQIGQQVLMMVVVIQIVQCFALLNVIQLFKIMIDGFGYD
jgi:hypothetical protein